MRCSGRDGGEAGGRRGRISSCGPGWVLLAVLLATARPCAAQVGDLAALSKGFEDSLAKVVADHKALVQAIPETYAAGLNAMMAAKQKAGDLDGLLQVRSEVERFERERRVPESTPAGAAPELAALQEQYRKGGLLAAAEKRGRILALADRYVAQLNERVSSSTQAGDIDGALAYRAEIERARALPEVAAAEFDRAADATAGAVGTAPAPGAGVKCPACAGNGKGRVLCAACRGAGECGACGGRGKRPGLSSSMLMCATCRGSGHCRACDGSGRNETADPCELCLGGGRVKMVELKAVMNSPGNYAGKTVCARVRVTRASLWGDGASWNAGTVSVALTDPSPNEGGAWVPSREVPVASKAVAAKLARLVGKGGGSLVVALKVGATPAPVIQDVFNP